MVDDSIDDVDGLGSSGIPPTGLFNDALEGGDPKTVIKRAPAGGIPLGHDRYTPSAESSSTLLKVYSKRISPTLGAQGPSMGTRPTLSLT